jgi:hypothetical protein
LKRKTTFVKAVILQSVIENILHGAVNIREGGLRTGPELLSWQGQERPDRLWGPLAYCPLGKVKKKKRYSYPCNGPWRPIGL